MSRVALTSHENRRDCSNPSATHVRASAVIAQQSIHRVRQAGDVVRLDDQPGSANHLRECASRGDDDRDAHRHRFERRQPEPFVERGQHDHRRLPVESLPLRGLDVAEMVRVAGERRARQFIEQRLARLCNPPGEDERRSIRLSLQTARRRRGAGRRRSCEARLCP